MSDETKKFEEKGGWLYIYDIKIAVPVNTIKQTGRWEEENIFPIRSAIRYAWSSRVVIDTIFKAYPETTNGNKMSAMVLFSQMLSDYYAGTRLGKSHWISECMKEISSIGMESIRPVFDFDKYKSPLSKEVKSDPVFGEFYHLSTDGYFFNYLPIENGRVKVSLFRKDVGSTPIDSVTIFGEDMIMKYHHDLIKRFEVKVLHYDKYENK